jgi:cytochrome c
MGPSRFGQGKPTLSRLAAVFSFTLAALSSQSNCLAHDASEGERLYRQRCASCHALQVGQNRLGPHLLGILGRRAGSVEGVRYSQDLQSADFVWDEQSLDRFLANPRQMVSGTSMLVNLPNEDQRKSIIAYLKTVPAQAN